jgi:lipopolysaccharide/colanic/teichoic acid biosynthesis glycosyltransferase/GGDEF domain-containing protein
VTMIFKRGVTMEGVLLKKIHLKKNIAQTLSAPVSLYDQNRGLYHDRYFNEILCLERKRAERSRKPFLLMLLDIKKLCNVAENNGKNNGIIKKIVNTLKFSVRDTDITGWYNHNSILGIIFTEMNEIDKDFLKKKIYDNLCKVLQKDNIDRIKISLHIYPHTYPGDHKKQGSDCGSDLIFYPDFTKQKLSKKTAQIIKRTVDITGSLFCIITFLPFFIIISICIKLTSKGPVFFKNERVGQFGKKFIFLKFRSMYSNTDPNIHKEYINKFIRGNKSYDGRNDKPKDKPIYKIKDDPRITPLGRLLRKTSLDEIPQFFNVLKGEMSLVGPRPPIPYEIENYDIWHKRRVIEIKPGITGLWQVEGRSSTSFDDMVRLDLKYMQEWSLWLDIKILLKTPWIVILCKGAY